MWDLGNGGAARRIGGVSGGGGGGAGGGGDGYLHCCALAPGAQQFVAGGSRHRVS